MTGRLVPVEKRGDWKTIDQRELSARRARKTQRRGQAAVSTGALLAGGAYATGSNGNLGDYAGNKAVKEAGSLRNDAKFLRSVKATPKESLKFAGGALSRSRMGAALIGGGALAGVGATGMLQGAAREGYHQTKINSRRKVNQKSRIGKRAPMDHEGSGYARYGNFSGKGKRLPDEFSKAAPLDKTGQLILRGKLARGAQQVSPRISDTRKASQSALRSRLVNGANRESSRVSDARGSVTKRIRNKDAEDDRQRRLGAGIAATGLGSALLLHRGVGGALRTTKELRNFGGLQSHKTAWGRTPESVKGLISRRTPDGKPLKGKGVAMTNRDMAEAGAGVGLGAGALGLGHYARSRRNNRWE